MISSESQSACRFIPRRRISVVPMVFGVMGALCVMSSAGVFGGVNCVLSLQAGGRPAASGQDDMSPFIRRLMQLDRNRDGFLNAGELPAAMSEMMKADTNEDGRLSPEELNAADAAARRARDPRAGLGGGGGTEGNRRRPPVGRAGRRSLTDGPGSPLDAAQILRFALTFDADKDGGLNAEELKVYAAALARRRAAARRARGAESVTGTEGAVAPPESAAAEEDGGFGGFQGVGNRVGKKNDGN